MNFFDFFLGQGACDYFQFKQMTIQMTNRKWYNDEVMLQNLFALLDLNHDGFLDVNEVGDSLEVFIKNAADYLNYREVWSILSLSNWIPIETLIEQIHKITGQRRDTISMWIDDINLENTPNITIWQFLRSLEYPGGKRVVDALVSSGLLNMPGVTGTSQMDGGHYDSANRRNDQASPNSYIFQSNNKNSQQRSVLSEDPFLRHQTPPATGRVNNFSPGQRPRVSRLSGMSNPGGGQFGNQVNEPIMIQDQMSPKGHRGSIQNGIEVQNQSIPTPKKNNEDMDRFISEIEKLKEKVKDLEEENQAQKVFLEQELKKEGDKREQQEKFYQTELERLNTLKAEAEREIFKVQQAKDRECGELKQENLRQKMNLESQQNQLKLYELKLLEREKALKSDLDDLREKARSSANEILKSKEEKEHEVKVLKLELDHLKGQLQQSNIKLENLKLKNESTANSARNQQEQKEQEISMLKMEMQNLKTQLEASKGRLEDYRLQQDSNATQIMTQKNQKEQELLILKAELQNLRKELSDSNKRLNDLKLEEQKAKNQALTMDQNKGKEVDVLKTELKTVKKRLQDSESKIKDMEAKHQNEIKTLALSFSQEKRPPRSPISHISQQPKPIEKPATFKEVLATRIKFGLHKVPAKVVSKILKKTFQKKRFISFKNFKKFMKVFKSSDMPPQKFHDLSRKFFSFLDFNRDGTCDHTEVANCIILLSSGTKQDKIRASFSFYDQNNSGTLDQREITNYIKGVLKLKSQQDDSIQMTEDEISLMAAAMAKKVFIDLGISETSGLTIEEFVSWVENKGKFDPVVFCSFSTIRKSKDYFGDGKMAERSKKMIDQVRKAVDFKSIHISVALSLLNDFGDNLTSLDKNQFADFLKFFVKKTKVEVKFKDQLKTLPTLVYSLLGTQGYLEKIELSIVFLMFCGKQPPCNKHLIFIRRNTQRKNLVHRQEF